ncbi:MAG: hypothetical protein IJG23_07435 [Clostridia bacterium]|nr:hypothetical protein [Clostridia bacterium]
MNKFKMKEFLNNLNKNEFIKACRIPMGYQPGCPMFYNSKNHVYLVLPYRKYQKTNQKGKFSVMPVEYVVVFELRGATAVPEAWRSVVKEEVSPVQAIPVGFSKLSCNSEWKDFPFSKPVGVFPHSALKNKDTYDLRNTSEKLYAAYDVMIQDMLAIERASGAEKMEFKQLIHMAVEPGLKPMYRLICPEFYEQFLA